MLNCAVDRPYRPAAHLGLPRRHFQDWLNLADAADRLVKAGVQEAGGLSPNA